MSKMHAGDPSETIQEFVRECLEHGGPKIEFATFSGKETDWRKDDTAVYLRLACHTRIDGDGKPYELWARLAAAGGLWWIPRQETEVMVLSPPNLDTNPGAAWCLMTAQLPPTKVSQDKAFLSIPTDTKLLASAMGFMFKANGLTLNMDDGKFVLSFPNGTRFEADQGGFRFVVVDSIGAIAAAHWIDGMGISTSLSSLGVPTLQAQMKALDGSVTTFGLGVFSAQHPFGSLGVAPVGPIAYGPGPSSLASATWKVQP